MGFIPKSSEKFVPTEAIRDLSRGSFEHLTLRIDDAIEEGASHFVGEDKVELARVATFSDRVIVGSSDGRYFSTPFKDDGEKITFGIPESMDVPTVDASNASSYINKFVYKTVDALLTGTPEAQKESIVALLDLDESMGVGEGKDLAALVVDIISAIPAWKAAFRENIDNILGQLSDVKTESAIEVKYAPLYNGTIPEERFHLYLEGARSDLQAVFDRLNSAETKVERAYLPFVEEIKNNMVDEQSLDTVHEFALFSEGVMEEIHDLREHVKLAIENERCAMCLGQIHDAIAESLTEYEIASAFVEHMASRFVAAE